MRSLDVRAAQIEAGSTTGVAVAEVLRFEMFVTLAKAEACATSGFHFPGVAGAEELG
jgi:hypothetical protein